MLLSSGFIAGGTLIGLLIAFFAFLPETIQRSPRISARILAARWNAGNSAVSEMDGPAGVRRAGIDGRFAVGGRAKADAAARRLSPGVKTALS